MNKTLELHHIVAPSFTFISPLSGELDFAHYANHMLQYTRNANIQVHNISSEDDEMFQVTFTIELTNSTASYGKRISDTVIVWVSDNLIARVEVGLNASDEDINKFKNIL